MRDVSKEIRFARRHFLVALATFVAVRMQLWLPDRSIMIRCRAFTELKVGDLEVTALFDGPGDSMRTG